MQRSDSYRHWVLRTGSSRELVFILLLPIRANHSIVGLDVFRMFGFVGARGVIFLIINGTLSRARKSRGLPAPICLKCKRLSNLVCP